MKFQEMVIAIEIFLDKQPFRYLEEKFETQKNTC